MKKHSSKYNFLLILIHTLIWSVIPAYASDYTDTLSLDPGIRHGVLPNGLTYYIKDVKNGSSNIDMRLVVKGGSAILDPDQYELQHFMEHVAFKAGKNMTMGKAHDLAFKLGEINGNTSFNFVQYYTKSTYTPEKRDIAFQLFQDIIWNLDLKEEYIDSERSIIINEIALRGGFRAHSILNGLESSMIGRDPETPKDIVAYINSFPHEPLIRYYKDWYRPDLMAILVVGDMDNVDEMEKEIKMKFSGEKPIKNPRSASIDYGNYRNLPPQFISQEHPYLFENSRNKTAYLRLNLRQRKERNENGLEILKNEQQRNLLVDLLNDRLTENQYTYNSNYITSSQFIHPPELGLQLNFTIEGGSEKMILMKTMQTLRQLHTYGFTKEEFIKGKEKLISYLSRMDTIEVSYWSDNILSHFVDGIILPQNKKMLLKEVMDNLTLKEFNLFTLAYLNTNPDDIDIIALAPPKHRLLSYSEKTIRDWIEEANKLPLVRYIKPKIPKELIKHSTLANLQESIIQKTASPLPKTKEYTLENGVKVVLNTRDTIFNQNTNQQNSIRFHAFTPVGIRCYAQEDYFSTLNAAEIVKNSGVGGLNKFELKRYLDSKDFKGSVLPYIDYDGSGIRGSVSLNDLETALQLIYLYFTGPNRDSLAFDDWKLKANSSHALNKINEKDFMTTIKSILGDSTYLPEGTKALEGVSKTDMDRALAIFNEIYGNAEDFTFIFTGSFPQNKVLALCQKYLGNLPVKPVQKSCNQLTTKRHRLPKPQKIYMPSTEYMQETKVQLKYISSLTSNDLNWKEEAKLHLLQYLMNFSIMQEMRFKSEEEGSYNISIWINRDKSRMFNEVSLQFTSNPEYADILIKKSKQFITTFKKNPIDAKLLNEYKNELVRFLELEKSEKHSSSISKKIYNYYKHGRPWYSIEEKQVYINSISEEDLRSVTQKLLNVNPFQFKMFSAEALP
ncbi:MAG TPA: insulinase family protein [Dysgonamonadaceae bacterium]|nr:insulinase family protein [Dysgonamonadaceae bacterium]